MQDSCVRQRGSSLQHPRHRSQRDVREKYAADNHGEVRQVKSHAGES
jgi:hypothetical protein